jgi:hypothetical protein
MAVRMAEEITPAEAEEGDPGAAPDDVIAEAEELDRPLERGGRVAEAKAVVPATAPRELAGAGSTALVPASQAAAMAVGSFVAGAVTLAVVKRATARRAARRRRKPASEGLSILGSRSFLVDVHLIARD